MHYKVLKSKLQNHLCKYTHTNKAVLCFQCVYKHTEKGMEVRHLNCQPQLAMRQESEPGLRIMSKETLPSLGFVVLVIVFYKENMCIFFHLI